MDLKICHVLISLEGNSATLYNSNHHAARRAWISDFFSSKKLQTIHYDKYEYLQVHIIQIHVLFF